MRYKRIGYNLNVMRQSACLVINPIRVDGYAAFFNRPDLESEIFETCMISTFILL